VPLLAGSNEHARMLAVVGPTAAGKSAVAHSLAMRRGAEIVAVDAFTIYRGMDIGTATPSSQQQAEVPYHLINELEPEQDSTVQWFRTRARTVINQILARGRRVLLVGGSGLYFRAVVDPLEFPPTDPVVRADLERRLPDAAAAFAELAAADPEAAQCMDPANHRRAIRALEVLAISGRPFSAWRRDWDSYESVYPDLQVIGLDLTREQLERRITTRVDAMLQSGFLREAAALHGRQLSRTAAAAIGYAELWDHLAGRSTLPEARHRIIIRTRQYAARQRRWFARDPRVRWTRWDDAEV
jgi:tRNA dimethylallyltransferase